MASGRSIPSRRRTRAKAAWTRSTSSRSSVSGRAISWGVWAQAKAPTSIRPSGRHPREHLVEHLVGQRAHLVPGERLDRMLHHDRTVAGGAQRLRLRLRRAGELGGDDGRRGNAVILEEHAVVHTARCAGPSVGERLDEHVGGSDDLVAQRVGRRPREGRLLLAHDGLRRRALAQELLDPVQQVIALGLGDVEQGDDLAVEARRPRGRLAGHGHGIGRVEVLGHRILLITRLLPFENVQPGTTAENRPAVPPATRILMCCGARNFGIGVASCSGSANLRSTCSGSPSPPFFPGTSSWTGRCSRSNRNRRTSSFDQPSPATTAACSGENTSSVSPQCVILWCSITAMLAATLASQPGPKRPAPQLMSRARRIGPFTTMSGAGALVVADTPCRSNASSHTASTAASTTGRYSGRQPAITAFTAIFSTVARP